MQIIEFAGLSNRPNPGSKLALYVDTDTGVMYRWTGAAYQAVNFSADGTYIPDPTNANPNGFALLPLDANGKWYPITSVLLSKTTDQSIPHGGAATAINFDAITTSIGDTSGIWAIGSPSVLTVPAGFTKARLTGQIRLDDAFVDQQYTNHIYQNGSLAYNGVAVPSGIRSTASGAGSLVIEATSPWLEVVAGDYFEFKVINTNATTDNWVLGTVRTWAQIELMP